MKELETDLAKCTDFVKILEQRRGAENQAFSTDIGSIKKRVVNFERYIKRLKRHVDQEKTTELITELENTAMA